MQKARIVQVESIPPIYCEGISGARPTASSSGGRRRARKRAAKSKLRDVALEYCSITDTGAREIGRLKTLTALDLSSAKSRPKEVTTTRRGWRISEAAGTRRYLMLTGAVEHLNKLKKLKLKLGLAALSYDEMRLNTLKAIPG